MKNKFINIIIVIVTVLLIILAIYLLMRFMYNKSNADSYYNINKYSQLEYDDSPVNVENLQKEIKEKEEEFENIGEYSEEETVNMLSNFESVENSLSSFPYMYLNIILNRYNKEKGLSDMWELELPISDPQNYIYTLKVTNSDIENKITVSIDAIYNSYKIEEQNE